MTNCKSIIQCDLDTITSVSLPWNKLQNKSILISGANGFLPAYMIETLIYLNDTKSLNINVIGLARNKEKVTHRFKQYLTRPDFHLIIQDVTHPFRTDEKINYLIHAASQSSPKYYESDPVGTLSANILGTHQLLELAKVHQSEAFMFFSTGEIYGKVNDNLLPLHENYYGTIDPLEIRSCYAESKRMGENMCISYAHQHGLDVKIIRPFHTYGPGLPLNDGRVFSDFVADIINNRNITILGDGKSVRSFCYLADATVGFFTVLLKGKTTEAYNIGNPHCILSVNDLAEELINIFKSQNLSIIRKNTAKTKDILENHANKSYPDISKVSALGWQPTTSIKEGFKKTVESFNELI